ncbi:HAMP domain-containing protein [Thermodesulfobium acidiphilum]|uniref:HAMP domain-containing protein n=1 Tax=Thermodesulfobium acidiphilum TaxID=1794699 RepID=A0A2R4VYW6_THEAF|nr:HAMP domain-containing protein [Thermodesulfobium acidiphilum]
MLFVEYLKKFLNYLKHFWSGLKLYKKMSLVFIVLSLIIISLNVIFMIYEQSRDYRDFMNVNFQSALEIESNYINSKISNDILFPIISLSSNLGRTNLKVGHEGLLKEFLLRNQAFNSVLVADTNGNIINGFDREKGAIVDHENISQRSYFKSALENKSFAMFGPIQLDSKNMIVALYPIFTRENNINGFIITSISLKWFDYLSDEINKGINAPFKFFIVSGKMNSISLSHPIKFNFPIENFFDKKFFKTYIDGSQFTMFSKNINYTPFFIIGGYPDYEINFKIGRLILGSLFPMFALLILAGYFGLVLGKYLSRPLENLADEAERISKNPISGEAFTIFEGKDEIARLSFSLQVMLDEFYAAQQQLKAAEEESKFVAQNNSVLMKIASYINSFDSKERIIEKSLQQIKDITNARVIMLYLLDSCGQSLVIDSLVGEISDDLYLKLNKLEILNFWVGQVFLDKKVSVVFDLRTNPILKYSNEILENDFYSIICSPLNSKEMPIGAILLFFDKPYVFQSDQREFLIRVSDMLSLYLSRIEREEILEDSTEMNFYFRDISIKLSGMENIDDTINLAINFLVDNLSFVSDARCVYFNEETSYSDISETCVYSVPFSDFKILPVRKANCPNLPSDAIRIAILPLRLYNKPYANIIVYIKAFDMRVVHSEFFMNLNDILNQKIGITYSIQHSKELYKEALESIAQALDARDPFSAKHSKRVSTFSVRFGKYLKLDKKDIDVLGFGALLHDIGKVGIPDTVLKKPGKLTQTEYILMQSHPIVGYNILKSIKEELMPGLLEIILYHHERYDGKGYPYGLSKDEIPFLARLVSIADSFEAMISDRPYRKGMTKLDALAEISRCSGTQFDPYLAQMFVRVISQTADED